MQSLWSYVYNGLFIPLFWLLLHAAAWFIPKIHRGIRGRRHMFNDLEHDVGKLSKKHRIWFHSSSLGEFEQAKPIIAALRKRYREINIVVTFFSPSGYEHSKNYKLADLITYIPLDTAANARRFLDLVRPTAAVMVRYDIWPNHVWELARRRVPIFIANATLRNSSARLLWPLRSFHHEVYQHLTSILTVSESDAHSFRKFGLTRPKIHVIGETRYDQVWQRSEEAKAKHLIPPRLLRRKKVFVVGSSWEEDEDVVLPAFREVSRQDPGALMILVPHEPTVETLERLELRLMYLGLRTIRFSDLNDYSNEQVIIVDGVGILMALYKYADVSYVGGSFKQGIHNVLEPAVYGCPVLFGPKHENSREALELITRRGAFVVSSAPECEQLLRDLLSHSTKRRQAGKASADLVEENIGATKRFIEYIGPVLKLT